MADEFIAALPLGSDAGTLLAALTEHLITEDVCYLVSAHRLESKLRWRNHPLRETWPEDLTLSAMTEGLLVSVHSGTRDQRTSLIDLLQIALNKMSGCKVGFEEV